MSDDGDVALSEVDIGEVPADESVKLHGPPGTGKTTSAAARVGTLIRDHEYTIGDVTWATYRKKLAEDVLTRLNDWGLVSDAELERRGKGSTKYIATMHAIGYRLMPSMPEPVEEWQIDDFCDSQGIQYWGGKPWEDTKGELLFEVFYWLKNNLLSPGDASDVREAPMYEDLIDAWPGVDVPSMWAEWKAYKAEAGVIDFYEMLERPLESDVSPATPVVVIDEYHDAYPLMAALAEQWVDAAEVAIVAGDPNQVINDFDGASPEFLEELELEKVMLDRSYRVPAQHMAAAEAVLSTAHEIPPVTPDHENGVIHEYNSPKMAHSPENGWDVPSATKAGSPGALIEEHGNDMMFLTRTRQQARGVGAALRQSGIPYQSQPGLGGWDGDDAVTRVAIYNALLKLAGAGPETVGHERSGLARYQDSSDVSPDTRLESMEAAELLRVIDATHLDVSRGKANDIADRIEENRDSPTLAELDQYVEETFWEVYTEGSNSVSALNKTGGENDIDEDERDTLVAALDQHGEVIDDSGELPTKVLTIHASKGQEAAHVAVYDGITRTIAQSMRKRESSRRNEYRTWYVALTRAKDRLHILRGAFNWTDEFLPSDLLGVVRDDLGDAADVPEEVAP